MFTLRSFLCVGGGGGGAYLQEREQHVQVPAVRLRWSVNTKKMSAYYWVNRTPSIIEYFHKFLFLADVYVSSRSAPDHKFKGSLSFNKLVFRIQG